MLERLEIRGYQSLGEVDIPLKRFTVVTGPTGSGKSASIRAVRMLALNARGTGYISNGRASCSVCAGDGGMAVRITRSRSRGKDSYQVAVLQPGPDGVPAWSVDKSTKLGGQVPQGARDALRLGELNFARQFDSPYLLNVPGTELARTLGELTNVTLVLLAVGEANRRRKRLEQELKQARERRAALLEESAVVMNGLGARRRAAQAAEEALERLQRASAALQRLEALTARLRAAQAAANTARAEAARREPPSLQRLEELAARLARLDALRARLRIAERDAARHSADASKAEADARAAHDGLHAALRSAGQCPTCGQAVA